MKKFFLFFFLALKCFAEETADPLLGFYPVSKSYKVVESSEKVVTHMPPVGSQGGIGLCSGFAAAAAIDSANCKALKLQNCSEMAPDQRASAIDLTRFNRAIADDPNRDAYDSKKDPSRRSSYKELHIGGNPLLSIDNGMNRVGKIATEKCAPSDQLVSKGQTFEETIALQQQVWARLEKSFDEYKRISKRRTFAEAEAYASDKIANFISPNFKLKVSSEDQLQAFNAETYGAFLSKLLVPKKCATLKDDPLKIINPQVINVYPDFRKGERSDYGKMIEKIKEVIIKTDSPIVVTQYCPDKIIPRNIDDCGPMHTFLLGGYRKVCKSTNDCIEMLQVHNSWGQSWQNLYSGNRNRDVNNSNDRGGWVDAKKLLARTLYSDQSLGWLEEE